MFPLSMHYGNLYLIFHKIPIQIITQANPYKKEYFSIQLMFVVIEIYIKKVF